MRKDGILGSREGNSPVFLILWHLALSDISVSAQTYSSFPE